MDNEIAFIGEPIRKQKRKSIKQNRFFKTEAKEALFAADNYYKAVLSHFICGAACGGFIYLAQLAPKLISAVMTGGTAKALTVVICALLYILSAVFFCLFFAGVYRLATELESEPDVEHGKPELTKMSVMLSPVADISSFRRTLGISLVLLSALTLSALPSVFVISQSAKLGLPPAATVAVNAAVVFCSVFSALFFIFLSAPLPYVINGDKDIKVFAAIKTSAAASLTGMWRLYSLLISFIPLILLSAATFGVLLFAYTLPYMTVSFARAGGYLYNLYVTERKFEK